MRVVVVIVTHRGPSEMLRRCVASVAEAGGHDAVVVVDNSPPSPAPSGTQPSQTERYGSGVSEVVTVPNQGFGAAANAGAARARATAADTGLLAIALLNDDVEVTARWLGPLVDALDADDRVGAVQPKLLLAGDGAPLLNSVGVQLDRHGAGSDIGIGQPDGPAWNTPRDIEIFTGGAVLLRDVFLRDLGGFDERYFLYYEDVDLALRGGERGWRFRCEPSSVVVHAAGSSTGALGDALRHLQDRNRLWVAWRFSSPAAIARALWLSVRRLRHPPRQVHARALWSGLTAAPRLLVERGRARRLRSGGPACPSSPPSAPSSTP
jgi:N-acetylglucosaminyl-diphospho-decaprenol L-rhamnosyltransferase